MRIAIVDDSKAMRRLQRDVIAELKGVEILEAEDGIDAIHKLRDIGFQVDLMLVDWVMPRMDGLTFVSQLKSHPNLKHIPILMVTSCADETRMRQAWQSGVDGYLLKPFSKEYLLKAILNLTLELPQDMEDLLGRDLKPHVKSFLQELPGDLKARIVEMSRIEPVGTGVTIVAAGEVPDYFYFLDAGVVEEQQQLPDGKAEVVRTYHAAECFSVSEFMTNEPVRTNFLTAAPCRVGRLPKEVFEGMLERFPKISLTLSRYLACQARDLEGQQSRGWGELSGRLEVLDLPTLIQAINLRQKTCAVELPELNAEITFICGQVFCVRAPQGQGEEAFYRIVAARPKQFKLVVKAHSIVRNVNLSTTKLLLNSAKYLDELTTSTH